MTKKKVKRTKADDNMIIRFNSIGLSLGTIGELLGVHPTTVSGRLKILNIEPTYTTHAFMENILLSLTPEQQNWVMNKCSRIYPIKELVKDLLIKEFEKDNNDSNNNP